MVDASRNQEVGARGFALIRFCSPLQARQPQQDQENERRETRKDMSAAAYRLVRGCYGQKLRKKKLPKQGGRWSSGQGSSALVARCSLLVAHVAHVFSPLCPGHRPTLSHDLDHTMIPDDNPWSSVQPPLCNTTHAYDLYPRSRSRRATKIGPHLAHASCYDTHPFGDATYTPLLSLDLACSRPWSRYSARSLQFRKPALHNVILHTPPS